MANSKSSAKGSSAFSAEEKAAMKDRAREQKAASSADPESEVLAKIAELPAADRALGERLHALIMASSPGLKPRLWYGQPAYSTNGKMVCFFQPAAKFKTRYTTIGFSDDAKLDDGTMWPTSYALTELTPEGESRIAALIRKAVGQG
jgi:hypothetical protein